jgi:hypothetical protein
MIDGECKQIQRPRSEAGQVMICVSVAFKAEYATKAQDVIEQ